MAAENPNNLLTSNGKRFWGAAADLKTLKMPDVSENEAILKSQFGAVTPEYSMKWMSTEAQQGKFTFSGSDALVKWAHANNKAIRGHTLLWHRDLPPWVSEITDPTYLTSVIENHVAHVVGHYSGQLYSWDVVNEIFNDDGTFRPTVFHNVLGEGFVEIAFRAARKADSNAKLYINDYCLDRHHKSKLNALVSFVKKMNSGGTQIINGIGTQMHLGAGEARDSVKVTEDLNCLASAGVEVAVTELDIAGASPEEYAAVAKACLSVERCVSITSWGVSDANSWRSSDTPLLFDSSYKPKSAYYAVLNAQKDDHPSTCCPLF